MMSMLWGLLAAADSGSTDLGFVTDLIVTAPLAGVMLWLYLDERKERRSLQNQLIEMIKVSIPALEKSTITVDAVVKTLDKVVKTLDDMDLRIRERDLEYERFLDRAQHHDGYSSREAHGRTS